MNVTRISDDKTRFHWKVHYPINNYNVTLNIGDYAHFSDTLLYETGEKLALDYYVMPYNLDKAKIHFKQVAGVLEAYAHYLGPYPYITDGYALVETPYLGMEHQGAIAYGNKYQRGYLGGMQPQDMHQDYIIVHETGHEYFGNWISCKDHAEMWIHESFTTYLESLYVEYFRGKEDALRYLQFQRPFIRNKSPMLGPLGVNYDDWGSSDIYYKGSWVLQTLRTGIGNDGIWFSSLRKMMEELGNRTVTTQEVIDFFNRQSGSVWDGFFEHYLQHAELPILVWKEDKRNKRIALKWESPVLDFELPLHWDIKDDRISISPGTSKWTHISSRYWDQDVIQSIRSRYLIKIREDK
jgi:aminopeptidase N